MTAQLTYGPADQPTTIELEPGDVITVHTFTSNPVTGPFVSLSAAKGLRLKVDGKYVTRRINAISDVEIATADEVSDEDVAAELDVPAELSDADAVAAAEWEQELADRDRVASAAEAAAQEAAEREAIEAAEAAAAALLAEISTPVVEAAVESAAAAAAQEAHAEVVVHDAAALHAAADAAIAEADAPVEISTATDVFDPDPIVDGKHLSQMRFAEVMVLAKRYRTPGRGVARIGALREGVAKAIHAEVSRNIRAAAALSAA